MLFSNYLKGVEDAQVRMDGMEDGNQADNRTDWGWLSGEFLWVFDPIKF